MKMSLSSITYASECRYIKNVFLKSIEGTIKAVVDY